MGDGNSPMSVGAEAALIEASRNLSQFGIAVPWPLSAFGFFKSLAGVPALLRELGAVDEAEGLTRHIGYLASKAACPPAAILGGEPFAAERKIILETLSNISATLRAALVNWSAEGTRRDSGHRVRGDPRGRTEARRQVFTGEGAVSRPDRPGGVSSGWC